MGATMEVFYQQNGTADLGVAHQRPTKVIRNSKYFIKMHKMFFQKCLTLQTIKTSTALLKITFLSTVKQVL